MNNGVDLTSNRRFTKGYGYFTEMESYEELLKAWDKTIREITRYSVIVENVIDKASERDVPDILCSALTDDCIARGKTIKEGGAVYDFISGLQVGIANMADCLAAIKKLVYEEKKITRQELWDAILDDFSSPKNKKIQEMLIREAPKYGNDDDYVDQLIVEAYDSYIEEIENIRIHAIIEDQLAEFVMQELLQLVRMLDKVCQRWLRRMDEMHSNLWQKVAVQHITAIKMDLQLCLKVCLSFVQIKLRVEFC